MFQSNILSLSIGDDIPDSRISRQSYSDRVDILGKPVQFDISESALRALPRNRYPILVELELYFSCLIRKQVRFREIVQLEDAAKQYTQVVPGLYSCFRAVTTQHCSIADVGESPPVQNMPVKKPARFVPDWAKIDYRSGQWLGEYGFAPKT